MIENRQETIREKGNGAYLEQRLTGFHMSLVKVRKRLCCVVFCALVFLGFTVP